MPPQHSSPPPPDRVRSAPSAELLVGNRPSLRSGLPFGVVAWAVLASELIAPSERNWQLLVAAALCLTVVSIGFVASTRRATRSWLDPTVAYLFCAFVVLARDAGGGATSGVSALYLVPVLWLALTGTRAEMFGAVAVSAACMVLPILIVGEPHYPDGDWRRAFVNVSLSFTIGGVAQWAVAKLRAESERRRISNRRVERLFSDAPHGVALIDSQGVIIRANASLGNLLGMPADQLEGVRFTKFESLGTTVVQDLFEGLCAENDATADGEGSLQRSDGVLVHVVINARRMADEVTEGLVMINVVDISERRHYEDRLTHLVDHDPVTGLASRRRFERELAEHCLDCERTTPRGALLLLDLDHFKQVNDSLGHTAGDHLLVMIGELLSTSVRGTDLVGRLGGDEFAVLLREADQETAEMVARRMVERVARYARRLRGPGRRVGASVGVVTFAAAAERGEDIFALADMTMYEAKDGGRGQVAVLAEGETRAPALAQRWQWQSRIEEGLENDRFVLVLQPILDLHQGRVRSAEALLRLREGDELVRPGEFIATAEAVGLMPRIDAWVVEHGVEMLARLREHDPSFTLEVNLSGLSMGHPGVEVAITRAMAHHPHVAGGLVLEVTETAAVADLAVARDFAARMTALGCAFALDDFGAGFGSLSYLRQLHFDYIKVDGEFVEQSASSTVDRAILHSIVDLAQKLGKRTVAEYVTTPEVLAVVRAEGVDFAQGHVIGAPMDLDDFATRYLGATWGGEA